MNKLATTLSLALLGLVVGFGDVPANAKDWGRRHRDWSGQDPRPSHIDRAPGQSRHFPGSRGKRDATERADAAAKQRHDAAVKKIQTDHAEKIAKQNANLKPGEKPIKSTGKARGQTLGEKQVANCKQQVAIQFVNKSGGVTSVEEAKRRQAQCVTMFRD
jgi:hypothetical protein